MIDPCQTFGHGAHFVAQSPIQYGLVASFCLFGGPQTTNYGDLF